MDKRTHVLQISKLIKSNSIPTLTINSHSPSATAIKMCTCHQNNCCRRSYTKLKNVPKDASIPPTEPTGVRQKKQVRFDLENTFVQEVPSRGDYSSVDNFRMYYRKSDYKCFLRHYQRDHVMLVRQRYAVTQAVRTITSTPGAAKMMPLRNMANQFSQRTKALYA